MRPIASCNAASRPPSSVRSRRLDQFDWSFNPNIPKKPIFELATCNFVREHRDVLLLGPPGVGKSFWPQALGYHALKAGFLVLYRSVFDLVRDFLHDEAARRR